MHLVCANVSTKFAGSRTSNSYNSVTSDSLMISIGEVTRSTSSIMRKSPITNKGNAFCAFSGSGYWILASRNDTLSSGGILFYISALRADSLVTSGSCFGSGLESRKYRVCSIADPLTKGGNTINKPRESVSSSTGPL